MNVIYCWVDKDIEYLRVQCDAELETDERHTKYASQRSTKRGDYIV